jgi:hypothetical protein
MKTLAVFLLLSVAASAQVLRPIDPRRTADASGKAVEMPTINFGTLPQPTRTEPVSPLTGQMREPGKTVETKRVDTTALQYATLPSKVLPQTNFTAKRAVVTGALPAADTVKTPRADIEKRVIRPVTPAGAEELKKQLNEPH